MKNLDLLCCPYCGGGLKPIKHIDASTGIIECDCSQYPVIDDIPVLVGESIDGTIYSKSRVLKELQKGDKEAALTCLMTRKIADTPLLSWLKRVPCASRIYSKIRFIAQRRRYRDIYNFVSAEPGQGTFKKFLEVYFGENGDRQQNISNYYFYKYGEPRYFSAKSVMPLYAELSGQPVLDVGCGTGQLTRELARICSNQSPVYALDINFFCVYAAKKFVYEQAVYVVCDINNGLPFSNRVFGGVFCSNTLHFIRNKKLLFQEFRRVANKEAVMTFASVRHSKQKHVISNCAVSVNQYKKLIGNKDCYVVPDDSLVDAYFDDKLQLDARAALSVPDLEKFGLLTFIAASTATMNLVANNNDSMNVDKGELKLNPLYQRSSEGSSTLVRVSPSEFYDKENYKMAEYFPRDLSVSDSFFDDLEHQRMSAEIIELYQKGVLINLPSGYC